MKKKYVSPTVEMESFQITQQIASCGAMKINLTDQQCVLDSPFATEEMKRLAITGFFLDGCSLQATGMDTGDGFCIMTNVNVAFPS